MLDLLGYTINTLTLMGMTLAIGIVVDDAIIVLENITRWIEDGTPPMEAARRGMDEIGFAVVAATISIAGGLPAARVPDRQDGPLVPRVRHHVATAVGISGFVALTLSPAVCARVLRPHRPERGVKRLLARGFDAVEHGYGRLLAPAMRHAPARASSSASLWVVARGAPPRRSSRGSSSPWTTARRCSTFTRAPEGSTIDYTDRYQRMAEDIVLDTPEVEKTFSVVALGLRHARRRSPRARCSPH